ncbi:MAG: flavodoxin [Ruminiclostridium sp.]|uniref:flavodoxin n=1 Tax=Ruminococcus sp. TaxID=41978 RepID=UPI0025FA5DBA|nr:flavodoxin [Ruminococcus sp.]MBR1432557.1 flavodoxin [Ruminococcus sp.]MBR1832643.1 flavodoxin [Ruminiclostridium sp.]
MKTAVIYWSGTGNTEAMAKAVAEGAGVEAVSVSDFSGNISDYDALAFGCPAMGDEQLEEAEFEPFFARIENELSGKKVVLFGSYDWGTGDWMHAWEERVKADGAEIVGDEGYITNLEANETELGELRELGKKLAE